MTDNPEFQELERLYTQADSKTKYELLALGYFMTWRRSRRDLAELRSWTRRPWLQRVRLLILGAWVYRRSKKGVAKPSN